jgi:integrator complex subunit 4
LGANHPDLTLPLVTSLLDIHPFFDTPEPDIEDPAYLSTLVLVLNAAQHCPTLAPLLDGHTRRHHSYLRDAFPHLIPAAGTAAIQAAAIAAATTAPKTGEFLAAVLRRVELSARMSSGRQLAVLGAACRELERLASIDAAISGPASFSRREVSSFTY